MFFQKLSRYIFNKLFKFIEIHEMTWFIYLFSSRAGASAGPGFFTYSVKQGGYCVCLGSATTESKMKYEHRQQYLLSH